MAFGAPLPWGTQLVLNLSRILTAHPAALLLACAALSAVALQATRQAHWRLAWQRRLLDWPGLGALIVLSVSARWAHTLSALLAAVLQGRSTLAYWIQTGLIAAYFTHKAVEEDREQFHSDETEMHFGDLPPSPFVVPKMNRKKGASE